MSLVTVNDLRQLRSFIILKLLTKEKKERLLRTITKHNNVTIKTISSAFFVYSVIVTNASSLFFFLFVFVFRVALCDYSCRVLERSGSRLLCLPTSVA